jgi:hypothetical protein
MRQKILRALGIGVYRYMVQVTLGSDSLDEVHTMSKASESVASIRENAV